MFWPRSSVQSLDCWIARACGEAYMQPGATTRVRATYVRRASCSAIYAPTAPCRISIEASLSLPRRGGGPVLRQLGQNVEVGCSTSGAYAAGPSGSADHT